MKHSFLTYFKGYGLAAILAPLLKLAEACLQLLVPLVLANIVNKLQLGSTDLMQEVGLLVLFAVLGFMSTFVGQYFSAKAAIGYTEQLSKAAFKQILYLNFQQQQEFQAIGLQTRLQQDLQQIQQGLNLFFRLFLRSPFIVLGANILLIWLNNSIGIVILMGVIVMYIALTMVIWQLNQHNAQLTQIFECLVQQSKQWIEGILIIRSLNQQGKVLKQYQIISEQYAVQQQRLGRWEAISGPFLYGCINLLMVLILIVGRYNALESSVLIASVNYLMLILDELFKSTFVLTQMSKAWVSWRRIDQLFTEIVVDTPSEDNDSTNIYRVENLTMRYHQQSQPILHNIDLALERGKWYGLTGPTSSGKSSLIQALAGVIPFQEGTLHHFSTQMVTWVPQQSMIWQGTIKSNLTMGNANVTDDQLWQILEVVQLADTVRQHPQQLLMPINNFGKQLSGGQKQRLMIARGLLLNRPLLILDDATSAMDYQTEQRLLQAIKKFQPNVTVLLVSQRQQVLKQMDQLHLMEEGHIIATGTWEELQGQPYFQVLADNAQEVEEVAYETV